MADRIFGGFFALLGLAIILTTQQIVQNFPGTGDPGPRILPYIIGALLLVLGLALAVQRRKPRTADDLSEEVLEAIRSGPDNPNVGIQKPPSPVRRVGIMLGFVAFIPLIDVLGFSISATLFLAWVMSLMDEITLRRVLVRSAAALVVTVILGLLMSHALNLSVPGVWFS
ncbi:MAG: hypothetical protein CMH13_04180 [Martelella sp.]|uniref:tripartite tricarboxylate transporter TctB family protein n=1 Tax=unclassified Martelella TaxID=2629616 RepID=UPI000C5E9184|nr:tripartite tricarboxylate transporter TctB family protein [Martelella sp.]MAU19712.1 hypothetical protein [Martelella sp.]|tara:strand:- start:3778 stop:4287 length:510 start_codon:yes stop_codon:yes gene_type:complete